MTIPAKALRDFAFPAVAAGQRHLAAAARLSAKDPSGGYHGSLPLDGTRYAHNGRKLSPAPTKAIREMAINAASRSTAMSLTTSSPTSGRSIPPGLHPYQRLPRSGLRVGWIDDSDMLARGYSGSRGSLDGWSTDNRLRADFNTGDWRTP